MGRTIAVSVAIVMIAGSYGNRNITAKIMKVRMVNAFNAANNRADFVVILLMTVNMLLLTSSLNNSWSISRASTHIIME